jgi:CBS domain-containing protein
MNVGDLCRRPVVTILPGATLTAAAQLMRAEHVGFLVVVEPARQEDGLSVVGVLTDRDIVIAVVAREADPRILTVGDVMTRDPLVAKDTSSVAATLRFMHEVGVRRVPVLNSTGQLAGVMALDDALKTLAEELNDIAGCIRSEQRVERCVRA